MEPHLLFHLLSLQRLSFDSGLNTRPIGNEDGVVCG